MRSLAKSGWNPGFCAEHFGFCLCTGVNKEREKLLADVQKKKKKRKRNNECSRKLLRHTTAMYDGRVGSHRHRHHRRSCHVKSNFPAKIFFNKVSHLFACMNINLTISSFDFIHRLANFLIQRKSNLIAVSISIFSFYRAFSLVSLVETTFPISCFLFFT